MFVQGDHYQFNAKKYAADPEARPRPSTRPRAMRSASATATSTSTRRRWSTCRRPTVVEQQRTNYERAAEMSALIREVEPADLPISIGGEIGEVGKQNSTEEELRAYLDGYRASSIALAGP